MTGCKWPGILLTGLGTGLGKCPCSEVDLDDTPGREERLRLAEDTRKHYERQRDRAEALCAEMKKERDFTHTLCAEMKKERDCTVRQGAEGKRRVAEAPQRAGEGAQRVEYVFVADAWPQPLGLARCKARGFA
jgi:hypothetical protein